MTDYKYYLFTAIDMDGDKELIFSSYDLCECEYEKEAEQEYLKEMGYTKLKISFEMVNTAPDIGIYPDMKGAK